MKKLINKIKARLLIRWMHDITNEQTLRICNHAILKYMKENESDEIVITYDAEIDGGHYTVETVSKLRREGWM